MLRRMSVQIRQIVIDVRVDGSQISGQVSCASEPPETFSGWLGLLRTLDGLLAKPDEEPAALYYDGP
jgi:hypothetical protein